jgi:superfamily I DNA/RNA helicase
MLVGVPDHPPLAAILDRLAPDQRIAATAPPGPILCLAPAGSGKTTTLVARAAWLVSQGATPGSIAAITFNRRAADELRTRIQAVLTPLAVGSDAVRVRTFHAMGLEVLRSAGRTVRIADRDEILRTIRPQASTAERRHLDDGLSRLKLDLGVSAADVASDPEPGPLARVFLDYVAALAASDRLDLDDLVVEALGALRSDAHLLDRWRAGSQHLLVDEVQDVDRTQLDLALLLAEPAYRIFLVGDDDQSIYGWRLADVRRVLGLASRLPGLRRTDLETNYRCPAPVVARAVRLVEHNRERFAKRIVARPGAAGRLVLAPDGGDDVDRWDRVIASWPTDAITGSTLAILTRTNRELIPAAIAALARDQPFRAADAVAMPVEDPFVDELITAAAAFADDLPVLVRIGRARAALLPPAPSSGTAEDPAAARRAIAAAVLAWATGYPTLADLSRAIEAQRARLRELRVPDALLSLATAHGTKGLEFDHVAVLMDEVRFPSARTVAEAADPDRALEEERRLAYVAWTRARRSLTLVYDPAAPSRFLAEAFDPAELASVA